MTPADFIQKWKDNKLSERAGAQAHFLDLCELLEVEKPSDPDHYCFERGAKRTVSELRTIVPADFDTPENLKKLREGYTQPEACMLQRTPTYGWPDVPPDMPNGETLRRLLKLNLERAAATR